MSNRQVVHRAQIHLMVGRFTSQTAQDFIILLRIRYNVELMNYLLQEFSIQYFQTAFEHRKLKLQKVKLKKKGDYCICILSFQIVNETIPNRHKQKKVFPLIWSQMPAEAWSYFNEWSEQHEPGGLVVDGVLRLPRYRVWQPVTPHWSYSPLRILNVTSCLCEISGFKILKY